ncbi:MAG: hypothetical protein L6Q26_03245 [Anaerolineales bacterium]|nr:hypothetical protein [Anaerolineales bacterium]NUQ84654.1 hypothetical protein [Anaerolineales bacterium]
MQLDAVIQVAIGLIFVWLVLSIGVMQAQEWVENLFTWRSQYLEQAVRDMLDDPKMSDKFFQHPSIQALYRRSGLNKMPPWIPSQRFAKVMLDLFANAGKSPEELPEGEWSLSKMQENLKSVQQNNPGLARKFGYILQGVGDKTANLDEKLSKWYAGMEDWYNDTMNMVSLEYKKFSQRLAFLIGLLIAVLLNVDSVFIATELWQQPTARAVIVAQAQAQVEAGAPPTDFSQAIESLPFPVGWRADSLPSDFQGWAIKAFGFLLSGLAAAQGAPFWFDALRKLVGFRSRAEQEAKEK